MNSIESTNEIIRSSDEDNLSKVHDFYITIIKNNLLINTYSINV